MFESRKVYF